MRARDTVFWTLVAVYAVLWAGGVAARFATPGEPPPAWAAPAFLLVASAIASIAARQAETVLLFAAGGFLVELIGVHAGVPFGDYAYTGKLGPGLGGVPPAISCAWTILLLFARDLGWRVSRRRSLAVLSGAAALVAFDLLIDPVATRVLDYWRWRQPGFFFGVPLLNFIGWFAVGALLLAAAPEPERPSRPVAAIGVSVLLFFAATLVPLP